VSGKAAVRVHELTDYSYLTEDEFEPDRFGAVIRCISGLGPSTNEEKGRFGGWYFRGQKIIIGRHCDSQFIQHSENPGIAPLNPCGPLSPDEEGVYSCIMMNSSMMVETRRMGLYVNGRSK